jgi:transposase-like protein
MPVKNETKRPKKVIEKAIKRHLEGGEAAVDLAKAYKVSRATFYNWLKQYKQQILEASKQMSPAALEKRDKITMAAEIQALRLENQQLRNRLIKMLIKSGEL